MDSDQEYFTRDLGSSNDSASQDIDKILKYLQKSQEIHAKMKQSLKLQEQRLLKYERVLLANDGLSDILDLDIGGTLKISVQKSLLCKYPGSALAAMFSGRFNLKMTKEGRVFVDRDGEVFKHVVEYLRSGKKPQLKTEMQMRFEEEIDFWLIQ